MMKILFLVLDTLTMVSTQPADRQVLDVQIAESSTVWIVSFAAKCRAEKKEDKLNNKS